MNRLIDKALALQRQMKEGKSLYPDDDAFVIPRGERARLEQLDLSIHPGTEKPRKLLKNDGTIVTQVVKKKAPNTARRRACPASRAPGSTATR